MSFIEHDYYKKLKFFLHMRTRIYATSITEMKISVSTTFILV
jgi:hypothetical protein